MARGSSRKQVIVIMMIGWRVMRANQKEKFFLAPFLGIQPCLSLSLSFFSLWMILGNNIRSWQPFVCCWASQKKKRSIKYFGTHNGSDMKNVGNKTKLNSRIQKVNGVGINLSSINTAIHHTPCFILNDHNNVLFSGF